MNDAQRAAVMHGGALPASPLLVLAGAGSGKTATLAARVARLVLDGADPQRVLLLTFSRRAALEMERRVGAALHRAIGMAPTQKAPSLRWCGTFHGVGARLLREYAARVGLPETFTIDDRSDSEDLMNVVRSELGLAESATRFPAKATCMAIYSRAVNSRLGLHAALESHFPWCARWHDELKRLFAAYVAEKQRQHVLDYDDLLLLPWQMLGDATLAAEIGARFDHVLVDEYQDTNRLQAGILARLKPDGRGVTVVGDDAQSIYSFRAAEVRNILDFPAQFEPPARIVALERNYRSTAPILDAANALIDAAPAQHAKRLWTDRASATKPSLVWVDDEGAQARWVADEVLRQREAGSALKAQAVLFRTSHHSAPLELELARRDIPFVKYGGLRFLDAAHIKDALALLRWAENPRCKSAGLRIAQRVDGIGATSTRRLFDAIDGAGDPAAVIRAFTPPRPASAAWREFVALFDALRDGAHGWPDELGAVNRWLLPQLARLHDDVEQRSADLAQLARMARGTLSRRQFLTDLALDPPSATSEEAGVPSRDDDYLILSTIHSAKGQEWRSVTVLNVVDGCLPSDMATGNPADIDEERRLLYVAMTRARDRLHLMVPQRFYVHNQAAQGDRHVYGGLSRFVSPAMQALFEHVTPTRPEATLVPVHSAGPAIDLAAQARALWS
nr:ATP-dependent helicase [Schlegelella koreensis]